VAARATMPLPGKYENTRFRRSRKKSNLCVVLHFAIIRRTISTPNDDKICDAFLSRLCLAGEFELFSRPSKSDFLRVHQIWIIPKTTKPWLFTKLTVYMMLLISDWELKKKIFSYASPQ